MEKVQEEALLELKLQLLEWNFNGSTSKHERFRSKVERSLLKCLSCPAEATDFRDLTKMNFPTNAVDALRLVIRTDMEEEFPAKSRIVYSDRLWLSNGFSGGPPRSRQDLRKKSPKISDYEPFHTYNVYRDFSDDQMDPFQRFEFETLEQDSFWYDRFESSDENGRGGTIAEAAFVCFMVQHGTCFNCKAGGRLRWNGGSSSSWQDMICISCESTYEIKSKADGEKVTAAFMSNKFRGGSYSRYWRIKKGLRFNQKMFLVVIPRKPSADMYGLHHSVFVAEIDQVVPRLDPLSFSTDGGRETIRIQSSISVHKHTKTLWTTLPAISLTDKQYSALFNSAFLNRFPNANMKTLMAEFRARVDTAKSRRMLAMKNHIGGLEPCFGTRRNSYFAPSQPYQSRRNRSAQQANYNDSIVSLDDLHIGDNDDVQDLGYSGLRRNTNRVQSSTKLSVVHREEM